MSVNLQSCYSWIYTDNHRTAWISLAIITSILLILNIISLSQMGFFSWNPIHYVYLLVTLIKMAIFSLTFYHFYKKSWREFKLGLYTFSALTLIVLILMFVSFAALNFAPGIFAFLFEMLYGYVSFNYLKTFSIQMLP